MPFEKQIGEKKIEVEVQYKTETKNSLSEVIPNWDNTAYHLRGTLKQVKGDEILRGMAVRAERMYRFYARFRADITVTGHRLKCGSRIFTILDLDNVAQKNREMVLLLKEEVS